MKLLLEDIMRHINLVNINFDEELTDLIINNKKIGSINIVLRLAIENDEEHNKNSIITCIPIGKNRLKSYINNGQIVYKNE